MNPLERAFGGVSLFLRFDSTPKCSGGAGGSQAATAAVDRRNVVPECQHVVAMTCLMCCGLGVCNRLSLTLGALRVASDASSAMFSRLWGTAQMARGAQSAGRQAIRRRKARW